MFVYAQHELFHGERKKKDYRMKVLDTLVMYQVSWDLLVPYEWTSVNVHTPKIQSQLLFYKGFTVFL